MLLTKSNSLRALHCTYSKPHLSRPGLWLHVCMWEQAGEREGQVRKTNHIFESVRRERGIRFLRVMTQAWRGQCHKKMLRLQVTREDKAFLLHNLLLPLSRDGYQNPGLRRKKQNTGQWRQARLEGCVLFICLWILRGSSLCELQCRITDLPVAKWECLGGKNGPFSLLMRGTSANHPVSQFLNLVFIAGHGEAEANPSWFWTHERVHLGQGTNPLQDDHSHPHAHLWAI